MNIDIPDWKNDVTVTVTTEADGTVVILIETAVHESDERVIRIVLPNSSPTIDQAIGLFVAAADVYCG